MRITSERMTALMEDLEPQAGQVSEEVFDFDTVRFWDGRPEHGVLYLARASQLPAEVSGSGGVLQLLCVADAEISPAYGAENVRMIVFPAGTDLTEVFNRLSGQLTHQLRGMTGLQDLIGHLVHGGLDQIVEAISEVLRKPVVLFGANLRVISAVERPGSAGPSWDAILRLKYYPNFYTLVPVLARGGIMVKDGQQCEPLSELPRTGGEVFAPVIADNATREVLGYLYFYEPDRDAILDNRNALQFICHTLSWRMWKYTHPSDRANLQLTDLIRCVLDGAMTDDRAIGDALSRAGLQQKGRRRLVVISSGTDVEEDANGPMEKWSGIFKETWPGSISLLYNGDLVLMIREDGCEGLAALDRLLTESGCVAGVSDSFREVNHYILNHYTRALAALQMALLRGEKGYVRYADIALDHLVHFGRVAASRAVVEPRLLRMLEDDKAFSTEYLDTLRCYLLCSRDTVQTCETLHIHRNTLFYRLKKIKEYLGEDFQQHERYIQLNISLAILEDLGEIPPRERFYPRGGTTE